MARKTTIFILLCFMLLSTGWSQDAKKALSLDDCIQMALENNITVETFRNLSELAGHNVRASYSGILPSVSVSGSASRFRAGDATTLADVPIIVDGMVVGFVNEEVTNPGFSRNSFSAGMNVNQNIYDGGFWWNNIRRSKAEDKVAELDLDVQTNSVITLVVQYYFDLLKQEKLQEVYQLAVERSEENLGRSEKMFEIGSVAKIDVFRARVNLGNDKIALINQRNTTHQSRQSLNIALGRDPDLPLNIESSPDFNYELPNRTGLIDEAYNNHPEIKRLEQSIRASEFSVATSRSAFLPQLGGWFSYNRSNSLSDKIYSDLNKNWTTSIGLSLSLNLFNGFQDQVNYQNSKILLKNSKLSLESYRLGLASSVSTQHQNLIDLQEIVDINRENLEAASEEYRLATERYRLGAGTSLDVREAQVNLTDAERILVSAEYNLILYYAQLQESLGNIQEAFGGN